MIGLARFIERPCHPNRPAGGQSQPVEIRQGEQAAIRCFGEGLPSIGLPACRLVGIYARRPPEGPGAMDHQKACNRPASGLFGGMNMIFDISDRARLPWRFFSVAKSSLRLRL